jgi:hypothetical protein
MELELALALIESNISRKLRHQDYDRVKKLAATYKRLITGEESDKLLIQFIQRESQEMFEQRVRLTQLITPSLCSGVQNAFYKVSRNTKVAKRIDIKDEEKKSVVEKMIDEFYGNSPDQNGLDYFLQSRFVELSFCDPNSWIVIEFDNFDNTRDFAKPRPFEVSAENAVNFSIHNEVLNWLLVRLPIQVTKVKPGVSDVAMRAAIEARDEDKYVQRRDGEKYTLYTDDIAVVYTEVDRRYMEIVGIPEGMELIELQGIEGGSRAKTTYLREVFDPKMNGVPAMRIGYKRDLYTDGRTYVAPFHPAMPYLMKSVKNVSEHDLTMTLHTFPQKLQYVQRCKGDKEHPCNDGRRMDESECKYCKGKGYIIHTSAQDAIILPMPDNAEDMLDLSRVVQYVTPPADLIKLQGEYVDSFEDKVHKAVFNSTVFVRDSVAKTATEKDMEMESVYDTLSPFASNVSLFYKFVVRQAMALADVTEEGASVTHAFPKDFKLKTLSTLIAQLKEMNDSGAPSFTKDHISDDIAELLYAEDIIGLRRYESKSFFFPFNGKTPDEIALLLAENFTPRYSKVLYANFEAIYAELERENKSFFLLDLPAQGVKIKAKVDAIIASLDKEGEAALRQQQDAFKQTSPFKKEEQPVDE